MCLYLLNVYFVVTKRIGLEFCYHTNLFIDGVSLLFGQGNDPVDHLLCKQRERGGFRKSYFLMGL